MDYMFTFLKKLDWQISEKSVSFITLYKRLKSSFYAPIILISKRKWRPLNSVTQKSEIL